MKLQTLTSPSLENLQPMLNESIYHFLVEFQNGRTDFSELSSIFFRLIQTMTDPPLEFIWFYSALTFHTAANSTDVTNSHTHLLSVKDLFHSLASFRNPYDCSYFKQVSIVAPVLYRLVKCRFEFSSFKVEIESLADTIVNYILMCCDNDLVEPEVVEKSMMGWVGVVPVWIADQVRENGGRVDGLQLFLPLSNDDIRRGIDGECGMDYLASIVMIEAFLFRLCLMFDSGRSQMELCKDVKSYSVQVIKGFKKNSIFVVMLFKLLLEPSLPVAELLSSTDELLLRQLLFEVALNLGSFIRCDAYSQLSDVKYKELVILWLFVTNSAFQFASEHGDNAGGDCYRNAFTGSQLPHQIISWVTGITTTKPTAPDISSPNDIIDRLLVLEKQGHKICDVSIAELHVKALKYKSMGINNEVKESQPMAEDTTVSINGRRKRDSAGFGEVQKQIKVMKCCHENLGDDSFYGKNEVANSVADQEMVDMVW